MTRYKCGNESTYYGTTTEIRFLNRLALEGREKLEKYLKTYRLRKKWGNINKKAIDIAVKDLLERLDRKEKYSGQLETT